MFFLELYKEGKYIYIYIYMYTYVNYSYDSIHNIKNSTMLVKHLFILR